MGELYFGRQNEKMKTFIIILSTVCVCVLGRELATSDFMVSRVTRSTVDCKSPTCSDCLESCDGCGKCPLCSLLQGSCSTIKNGILGPVCLKCQKYCKNGKMNVLVNVNSEKLKKLVKSVSEIA